ncbi:MAG: PAAR-like protein [Cyanobacteria bacterium P01_D01_bin.14]
MPGYLLHGGATVVCLHTGQAQPLATNPRVKVNGQPIVTQTTGYTIAGCTLPPPTAANGPCATAQWMSAATRVKANGVPVLLQDSQAICAPTGTSLNVVMTQTRVRGI